MKKAVLVEPPQSFASSDLDSRKASFSSPLGVVAVGSYLAAHGVPVEIVDVQMDYGIGLTPDAERLVLRRVTRDLLAQKDAIAWVGISQIWSYNLGMELAREVRQALPQVPIIMGGYFPSFAYRQVLEECPAVTAVVRGDGEAAALRISRRAAQGRPFLRDDTPNLAWREGGRIATSRMEPMGLGDLPICDYSLLRHPAAYPTISVYTSRGCPWSCRFCPEAGMRPYAAFPAGWVRRQLSHVVSVAPCKRVLFADPTFGVGRERAKDICGAVRDRRLRCFVESRADAVDAGLVRLLAEAGFDSIYYGVESAHPPTLVRMGKVRDVAAARRFIEKSMRAVQACFEEGVTPIVGVMLAYPGDTESSYRATLAFARRLRHLHDTVKPHGGKKPGLFVHCHRTGVIDGTSLARARLRAASGSGGKGLSHPPRMAEATVRYVGEIGGQSVLTPLAVERLSRYWTVSLLTLLENHPGLRDDDGVLTLGDILSGGGPVMPPKKAVRILNLEGPRETDGLGRRLESVTDMDPVRGAPVLERGAGAPRHPPRPWTVAALSEALADKDAQVRREAGVALAGMGPAARAAAGALAKALRGDPDGQSRRNIALAFSKMGRPPAEAAGALVGALKDADLQVRREAAYALSKMEPVPASASAGLIEALAAGDAQLTWAVALAMGRLSRPSKKVLEALAKLASDPDQRISKEASGALSRSGPRGSQGR
ncbi:MAG: HEAT repeat domain-containing protein [Elusimicrobia bacterium]|nr:HEAT repeat domain-containing protein [Elusimicrobiota bacterium]